MSDLMLLGILRMPDGSIAGDCAGFMQFVSAARSAADRIESDAKIIAQLRAELEAREADRLDAERYRGLLGALHCGDIPMKESSISLNVCGVPPDKDEFDEAIDFALAQRQEGDDDERA